VVENPLRVRPALDRSSRMAEAAETGGMTQVGAEIAREPTLSRNALAARWYAKHGLRVHPLRAGSKLPMLDRWQERATTDQDVIAEWWKSTPQANVGLLTSDRRAVLDVDPRHGGDETLAELEERHGRLPDTCEAQTAHGGRHIWLDFGRVPIRNSAGKLGPGLDIRASGGFVVAPPSVLSDGGSYLWLAGRCLHELPVAPAPVWMVEALVPRIGSSEVRPSDEWAALIRGPIVEGQRNNSIARLAGHLFRRRPAPRVVLEIVRAVNDSRCKPPLSDEELARTVDSIAARELERMKP
jgi:hypothetical protein